MLKRYMHKRERYFAMLNDNRVVRPFEWGTEFIIDSANGDDPRKLFREYSKNTIANSDEFFSSPDIGDFRLESASSESRLQAASSEAEGRLKPGLKTLTWTSGVETTSSENNTAYATYFPHETNRKSAVVVLPHWNAKAGTYFDLCKFFNKV